MRNLLLTSGIAAAICALFTTSAAQALQANATVTLSLPVNSPTCTVANSASTVTLQAASTSQTAGNYQTANLPLTGLSTTPTSVTYWTSAALNQTALITCNQSNTPITSVIVAPGPNAALTGPGLNRQYMIDTAATPNRLDNVILTSEQVSVNGAAAPLSYQDVSSGVLKYYTTPFSTGTATGSPATSTATVVWRPQILFWDRNVLFTNPTGGSYNGSFQIQVNY